MARSGVRFALVLASPLALIPTVFLPGWIALPAVLLILAGAALLWLRNHERWAIEDADAYARLVPLDHDDES